MRVVGWIVFCVSVFLFFFCLELVLVFDVLGFLLGGI